MGGVSGRCGKGGGGWCCWRGLNSRPLPYQGSALPLSYNSARPAGGALSRRMARPAQPLAHAPSAWPRPLPRNARPATLPGHDDHAAQAPRGRGPRRPPRRRPAGEPEAPQGPGPRPGRRGGGPRCTREGCPGQAHRVIRPPPGRPGGRAVAACPPRPPPSQARRPPCPSCPTPGSAAWRPNTA